MSVNAVSSTTTAGVYSGYETAPAKTEAAAPEKTAGEAAVFEKSDEKPAATYKINKMSAEDRASLVQQLKADQQAREANFLSIVNQMITGQAKSFSIAMDSEDMWHFLAEGKFTVDPATKAQAQADIAEDGYWGVKQTSQRLFDFASALAGDDVDKMKEMQAAMQKGFDKAAKTWGRELPDISKQTMDAANKLFDDYYAAMGVAQ